VSAASEKNCKLEVLAALSGCSVSLCEHGTVHLAIGAVTLQLQREALSPLAQMLTHAAAAARLAPARSSAEPMH
jgi:hypothetical protein